MLETIILAIMCIQLYWIIQTNYMQIHIFIPDQSYSSNAS